MSAAQAVHIDRLPQSAGEFAALQEQVARTPQGGAAMMVVALLLYAGDETLGQQCLAAAVGRERLQEGPRGFEGWQLRAGDLQLIRMQVGDKDYIPRSYFAGATPEDSYRLPSPPYVLEFSDNPYSGDPDSGRYKVFVACSGASTPRPVTLERDEGGIWRASEWSSLVVGVQAPAQGQS